MLTVTGLVMIDEEPVETKTSKGSFFNFRGKGKHPREEKYTYYSISLFVREKFIEDARQNLIKGIMIQLRIGELDGRLTQQNNIIFNNIKTTYDNIETLNLYPNKQRKEV